MSSLKPHQKYIIGIEWMKVYKNLQICKVILESLENKVQYISDYHIYHWTFTIMEIREKWLHLLEEANGYSETLGAIKLLDEELYLYISILEGAKHHFLKQKLE